MVEIIHSFSVYYSHLKWQFMLLYSLCMKPVREMPFGDSSGNFGLPMKVDNLYRRDTFLFSLSLERINIALNCELALLTHQCSLPILFANLLYDELSK